MQDARKILGLVLIFAILAVLPVRAAEDQRLTELRTDLESSRQTLAEVTEPKDKEIWEKRIKVLEAEIQNVRRMATLEEKEAQAAASPRSAQDLLLEALSSINPETEEIQKARDALERQIQWLIKRRAEAENEIRGLVVESEADADRQADLEQQRKNIDAEMQAKRTQKEGRERDLQLRQDAARIKKELAEVDLNPRLTLRLLADKRRRVAAAEDTRAGIKAFIEALQANREQVGVRLDLARERNNEINAEYENLRDKYQIEKKALAGASYDERNARQQRLSRMLSSTKSEMRLLGPRIGFLEEQMAAFDDTLALAEQQLELVERQIAYYVSDYAAVKGQFRQRVGVLGMVLGALLLLEILIENLVLRFTVPKERRFIAARLSRYLAGLVLLVILICFFFEDLRTIATILGLATAAVVIALQDLFSSFVAWFVITFTPKIKVGDRVEIDGVLGDVIDIQILRTTILECNKWLGVDDPTGRIVLIPNNFIFKQHVFNYSYIHPMIWHKLEITVTFETPPLEAWETLERVLQAEVESAYKRFQEVHAKFTTHYKLDSSQQHPKVLCHIADSGVLFKMFYPAHYREASSTRSRIMKRILEEFARNPRLQFAYPTMRNIPTAEADGFKVRLAGRGKDE